ncbi:MAG: hypothetical protein ACRDTR_07160 [Rubrobacter sp.]
MAKKGTSFRLSEEGLGLINDLSTQLGISQADVVEMSVRVAGKMIARETGAEVPVAADNIGAGTVPNVPELRDEPDNYLHSFTQQAILAQNEEQVADADEEWQRRGRPDVVPREKKKWTFED